MVWLQFSTKEPWWLKYLKSVLLKILANCSNWVGFPKSGHICVHIHTSLCIYIHTYIYYIHENGSFISSLFFHNNKNNAVSMIKMIRMMMKMISHSKQSVNINCKILMYIHTCIIVC